MVDLPKKKTEELKNAVAAKRRALLSFRFSASGSKTRNTKEGRDLKKEIARILTELNTRV